MSPPDSTGSDGLPGAAWHIASAHVFVDLLDAPELDDDALHHFASVLRLRVGATICAADGAGGWCLCAFTGSAALDPIAEVHVEPPPRVALTVGFSLVKGERPELVVQKLTELGVDRIVPFVSERSVVRWNHDRAHKQFGRLRRVVRSAGEQSRRLHLPEVVEGATGGVANLAELLAPGVVVADAGGRPLENGDTTLLVGPEGGWAPGETGAAQRVALAADVLRAETAAISAGALLSALRLGLVSEQKVSVITQRVGLGTSSHGS